MSAHGDAAVRAIRGLAAGPGGTTLVVVDPREDADKRGRLYAGVQRAPAATLLEALLTFAADPTYTRIGVFTGVGKHLPRLRLGNAVVGEVPAVWMARGRADDAPAFAVPPVPLEEDMASFDVLDDLNPTEGPRALFHDILPDWGAQADAVLMRLENLAGLRWDGSVQTPAEVRPPRTLMVVDETLLRLRPHQVEALRALAPPDETHRIYLETRFNGLPARLRGTPVDLILFGERADFVSALRDGTTVRRSVGDATDPRRSLFPELRWTKADAPDVALSAAAPDPYLGPPSANLSLFEACRTLPPTHSARSGSPTQELEEMIGLAEVKQQVRALQARSWETAERRRLGLPVADFQLHTIFYGNPGTGKTTVASILARIWVELGLLSGSKVTTVSATDLVVGYVSQTAANTRAVLQRALGGVLFIDEAYRLKNSEHSFGGEAVDEMVAGGWLTDRHDQLAVILAGYRDQLDDMFRVSNPGFRRRFQHHLTFTDYTDDELGQIFEKRVRDQKDELTEGCAAAAREILRAYRVKCERDGIAFGNAGEVGRLLDLARNFRSLRLQKSLRRGALTAADMCRFVPEDVRQVRLDAAPEGGT